MSSDLSDSNSRYNSLFDYEPAGQLNSNNSFKMITSRAMLKAQDYRAKNVTFYMNGDPFKPQFRVTIRERGRDFPTFAKFLDHLTDRTKLPIKFVFNSEGKRLLNVDDLEHNSNYICSQTAKFYHAQYGSKSLKSNFRTSNFSDIRPFLRPLSSKNKYNNRSTGTNSYNSSDSSLESKSVNGLTKKVFNKNFESEESSLLSDSGRKSEKAGGSKFIREKVVTIINRKLPSKSSRVLLNLRSASRTFEHVVKDLGESVSLPMARILLTPFGNEVRSISQLRRSLSEIDTFFVDDLQLETLEDWDKRNSTRNKSNKNQNENLKPEFENKQQSTSKDELIERLSLAASEELSKKNTTGNKEKKVVMVTPVFNESLNSNNNNLNNFNNINRQSNLEQFDTLSIDSFDTLPETVPETVSEKHFTTTTFPTTNPTTLPHPSLLLLNGFTAEFKIDRKIDKTDKSDDRKMNDKQIQVDIRYLPIDNEEFNDSFLANKLYTNKLTNLDQQVPSFYVLDDLFGNDFKRKNIIKNKNLDLFFRSDNNLRTDRNTGKSHTITDKQENTDLNNNSLDHRAQSNTDNMNRNNLVPNGQQEQSNQINDKKNSPSPSSAELNDISSLTEPNSVNNSRNSFLDETNSFSNSVTPDPNTNSNNTKVKERKPTPMPSPNRLSNHLNRINQLNQSNSNGDKPVKNYESQLINGSKVPNKKFKLRKVFGYNGNAPGSNLFLLDSGEIAYFVGIFVVLWDPVANVQRHYSEHTEDVCCMNIDHSQQVIVSVQKGIEQQESTIQLPIVKVWNYKTLDTLFSFSNFEDGAKILDVVFSKSSFLLILVLVNNNVHFYYYDWKSNNLIAKTQKLLKSEEIYGAIFHPNNDNHIYTYGKRHLNLWVLHENNELVVKKTFKHVLKGNGSSITCLTFLDKHLVAADTEGLIFIWSPTANDDADFDSSVSEIKAHDSSISSMLAFPTRCLVTADSAGFLKTWTFDNLQFNLQNVASLPQMSGAISSLSFANEILSSNSDYFLNNIDNEKLYKIYIGTNANMIFSGSCLQATQYIILYEGHSYGIRAIAVDSVEKSYFYTAGIDHKICKWSKNLLLWCVKCKYQCTSLAVYPNSEILAVGCTNGLICILSTVSSEFITQISLSNSAIGCLAYSPNNLLLAAGTENGILHILPVFDNGNSYDRISALKCNYPILTIQWSSDCKKLLTSINDNDFQEILLWNLSSSNFIKGTSIMSEQIVWTDGCCLSGDDVIGVWDNVNLENVINLCCHCNETNELIITGDDNGNLRLFTYPCLDQNASFFLAKQSSNTCTEVRFLKKESNCIVSSSIDGSIYLWDTVDN